MKEFKVGQIVWVQGAFKATITDIHEKHDKISVILFADPRTGLSKDDLKKTWTYHSHLIKTSKS